MILVVVVVVVVVVIVAVDEEKEPVLLSRNPEFFFYSKFYFIPRRRRKKPHTYLRAPAARPHPHPRFRKIGAEAGAVSSPADRSQQFRFAFATCARESKDKIYNGENLIFFRKPRARVCVRECVCE